ncbi:cilia- and flagella-associated protein 119 [Spea bombifrons]|uniref:cilia- and flagella-associated protein 119 n=1 Tax=Spea bombifrons TaxID=233779 RepID=UPI00234B9730|nr:cilia- and flagella-associated protein 119 [Spea bombifrons]
METDAAAAGSLKMVTEMEYAWPEMEDPCAVPAEGPVPRVAGPRNSCPGTDSCVLQTKARRPRIWSDLPKTSNEADFCRVMSAECGVSESRMPALLDVYYYALRFCQDCAFSEEQTSCLINIVKETHMACMDTPLGNADESYSYFNELLLCHAVHRPPFSVNVFSQQQIQRISRYFLDTYFRHFKLYKYVFTPQVRLDLSISYKGDPRSEAPEPQEADTETERTNKDV